jgi:hypothetical protein
MDINFIADPNLIPKPRHEIRIEAIRAEPLDGGKRIRIELHITPFAPADRPNIDIQVYTPERDSAGSIAVIETMHNQISVIFHVRDDAPLVGACHIRANLYYGEELETVQSSAEISVNLPEQLT